GDHGSTFAGGPIAAAAALATLQTIDDAELLRRVRELGARLEEGLGELEAISEVRGRGLMVGVSLVDGIDAAEIARRTLEAGAVIIASGARKETITRTSTTKSVSTVSTTLTAKTTFATTITETSPKPASTVTETQTTTVSQAPSPGGGPPNKTK